jgi:integrase/recombinase XerD
MALRQRLKVIEAKAGVGRLNPYRFRHTFGTVLYFNGNDINHIARQMGYTNINTTKIYVHTPESESFKQMEKFGNWIREAEVSGKSCQT